MHWERWPAGTEHLERAWNRTSSAEAGRAGEEGEMASALALTLSSISAL